MAWPMDRGVHGDLGICREDTTLPPPESALEVSKGLGLDKDPVAVASASSSTITAGSEGSGLRGLEADLEAVEEASENVESLLVAPAELGGDR
jgi:hypothetical protein